LRDLDSGNISRLVQPGTAASLVTPTLPSRVGVSDDGQVVTFVSDKRDLVPTLTVGEGLFRLDRALGALRHLTPGTGSFDFRFQHGMSADGERVAFSSRVRELQQDDSLRRQIYLFDAQSDTTVLVGTDETGVPGDADSFAPYLTPDGRTLVFATRASNWNTTPRVVGDLDILFKSLPAASLFRSGFE
jgi:Tol biopolymer transport system component